MACHIARIALPVVLLVASVAPSFAQTVQSTVTLLIAGDAEQRTLSYDCGAFGPISVGYIDAAPNFLALVPYEGKTLIFAAVLSTTGVRYAAGNYAWTTDGTEASFSDLTAAEDAPPLASCSEITNTP